jgi:hypothetical protein
MAIVATMADSSNPGSAVIPYAAVAGYIGGDTPHVWSDAQWSAQTARWRLPIWVYGRQLGAAGGAAEGAAALAWAKAHHMPPADMIVIDMETDIDADYVNNFAAADGAHVTCVYGSTSTVFSNPRQSGGYWVANYVRTGPFVYAGSWATQYSDPAINGTPYDLSALSTVVHMWDTQPVFSVTITDRVTKAASTRAKTLTIR